MLWYRTVEIFIRGTQNNRVPPEVAVTYKDQKKVGSYVQALLLVGLEPVPVSPEHNRTVTGLDGPLMPWRREIDPHSYGQDRDPQCHYHNPTCDRIKTDLLGEALDRDLPVLAICRGMQLFNVYHNDTLIQHLKGDLHKIKLPPADSFKPVREVMVGSGTKLAGILGKGKLHVNSRHHQVVDKLAANLRISAKSVGDEVIQAVERPDKRFAIAINWHPEDQVKPDEAQRNLFRAFAEAVEQR